MRSKKIENLIQDKFPNNAKLEIVDESHQHAGRQGQESHFKILLVADAFAGKSRVARQRELNFLLKEEFDLGLHALSMRLLTEAEYGKQIREFETPDCQGGESESQ